MNPPENERDVNKAMGYVYGCLYSSGSLIFNKKYSNYQVYYETRNKDLAKHFLDRLNSFTEKKTEVKEKSRREGERYFYISLYSKSDVEALITSGLGTRKQRRLPERLLQNEDFLRMFLRGILDSKATIRNYTHRNKKRLSLRIFSTDMILIEDIGKLLSRFSIKSIAYRSGLSCCLEVQGKTRLNYLLQKIGMDNREKFTKLDNALNPGTGVSHEPEFSDVNST